MASTYHSKPWQRRMTNLIATNLIARRTWLGLPSKPSTTSNSLRLLDYACGTGSITAALAPYIQTIRGLDVSENMVDEYNKAASSTANLDAKAMVADLCGESVPEGLEGKEWHDFDLAVVGLGFHHFESPERALKRLAERVKVGEGRVCIIDFLPSSSSSSRGEGGDECTFPDMAHTIHRDGFERQEMMELFAQAGMEEFGWSVVDEEAVLELEKGTRRRKVFFAWGTRQRSAW